MFCLTAALFLWCQQTSAATLNLIWDPSSATNATYRLYQSTGAGPFGAVQVGIAGVTATVTYDATVKNQWYVTAYSTNYAPPETPPSNILVRDPPPPVLPDLSFEAEAGSIIAPFYVSGASIQQDIQTTVAADGGRASFQFTITNAGTYTVSALVNAPDGGSDSVFLNIDLEPGDLNVWAIPNTIGFESRTVRFAGETNDHIFALTAMQHVLIIRGREAGCQLDRITIAPTAVTPPPQPIPGPPPSPTNLRSVQVTAQRVDLSWLSDPSALTEVWRSVETDPSALLETVSAGTMHTSAAIRRKRTYVFKVRSRNTAGLSEFSNSVIVNAQ